MFRLHIDIPLDMSEANSIEVAELIAVRLKVLVSSGDICWGIAKIQYRLANDEDRTVRNYLLKDSEGHVSTKKCVIDTSGVDPMK